MNKKEVKKAPALRFKGFTNDWEQQSLKKIFTTITDYVANGSFASLRHNVKTYKKPNYAYLIRLMDASNNWNGPWLFTDKKGYDFLSKSSLKPKDILLSNVGAGVGKTFQVPRLDKPMTLAPNAILLRSNKLNNQFCFYLLKYPQNKNKVLSLVGVSAQPKLNKTDFGRLIFNIPNDRSEQDKISKILSKLDKIVNLQQRKLKDIQLLKKAYLKAIFKSNKSTYKLKDIADYRRGSFPQPYGNPKWYGGDGSLPFVQVIDVAKNLRLYNSTKQRISRLAQSKSVFVPKGSILITLQGSIGKVAITQYDAFVDRTLLIISNLKKDVDKYYFAYALQDKFNEEKRKAPGGTIKTITKNALSEFQIKLPKKDIQKKQSSILQKIDKDIYIINLKLSELSKFKQFLLQNMFI